jgi:hypothetical protein|nr:MAG TPA: hypothetical protein [Caudoviricetes sp.]DAG85653.1 MAG TPA: hypothetical protein [Caudoviricetes sp.]
MIYILILIYLLIGTIVSGFMQVNGETSLIPLFFWPLTLFLMLIFGAFNLAFFIGEKIAEKIR